jgi:uncharacterized protein
MSVKYTCLGLLLVAALIDAANADPRVEAGIRAYTHGRYVEAAEWLTTPAREGNAVAETYLGFMYQQGRGVPKDFSEAGRWVHAAAEQGEPSAQFFLGSLYDRGFGVAHDFVQSYLWFDLAAAHATPRTRDYWSRMRDAVANKLTYQELAEAQAKALAFSPKVDP